MTYDWWADAACGGGAGDIGALFFPEDGHTTRYAKDICGVCPVTQECLDFAMASETGYRHGVWGGLSAEERNRLRRAPGGRYSRQEKDCPMCGARFQPPKVNQKYCSGACRSRALRRRQSAYEDRRRRRANAV